MWRVGIWTALAVALIQASATAQESGKLKDKVTASLKSVAGGSCPESLMNALLLDQCEQQLDRMQDAISKLGPIKEARYRGIERLPTGVDAEVYRVVFERGSMTWMAATGPNGKLSVLWSPG
jgi:hypothetical protein